MLRIISPNPSASPKRPIILIFHSPNFLRRRGNNTAREIISQAHKRKCLLRRC
ncbi:hypothetical protein [Clostridium tagluense]|uniref:hypothetical protein n=1 Tax=Clostridium tagluense TaxID=360422 RepID=UPI001A9B5818|nr:hypothetical protein [Clostridium tagluense]